MDTPVSATRSGSAPATPRVGPWATAFWLVAAVSLAAFLVRMATGAAEIGQDQAWLLYAAERMMHGVQLYGSQLTETNPPLIIWMSALPVALGRMTGIPVPAAFYAMVVTAMVGSAAWCYRLLAGTDYSRTQRLLLAGCVLLAESRPVLEALGQREHLLVLLILPLLVALGVRRRAELSVWRTISVSMAAALGICLKPQQVILLAGFLGAVLWRLWRLWREKQRDDAEDAKLRNRFARLLLAIGVICGVCAAYGSAVLVFAPLYVRSEMKLLVETYWAIGTYSIPQLVFLDHHFLAYVAIGLVLWLYARGRGLSVAMPGYLLLSSVAASIAFDLQHTGFMYQHIPQDLLAELAIFLVVVELVCARYRWVDTDLEIPRWAMAVFAVAFSLIAGAAAARQHRSLSATRVDPPATLREFYASLPEGTPVLGLSTNPQANFPYIEQYKLVLASRFVHLWMLPAVEQNEWYRAGGPRPRKVLDDAVVASVGALQRSQVAEDLVSRKPVFVVVPRCLKALDCEAIGEAGFEIVSWLQRDAGFAAEWEAYSPVRVVTAPDQGLVYDVYRRRDPATLSISLRSR